MATVKKIEQNRKKANKQVLMRKDVEKLEPLALMVGMYNGEIDMERMIWWFLKKLSIELIYDPEILLLNVYTQRN